MKNRQNVAIVGAGGFGQEVFNILDKELYRCVGFIDYHKTEKLPVPIIGIENEMVTIIEKYNLSNCIFAIGDMKLREKIKNKIDQFSINYPVIIDSSVKSFTKDIGCGAIIYPGVIIMNNCTVGNFTLINSGVTMGHNVIIGNFCNINPGVNFAGNITVGDGTLIGIGACIREKVKIGKNAIIGAGSVVLKDVPDNAMVYGVPARVK